MLNGYSASSATKNMTISSITAAENTYSQCPEIAAPLSPLSSDLALQKATSLEEPCDDPKLVGAHSSIDTFNQTNPMELSNSAKKRFREGEVSQHWESDEKNDSLVIRTTNQNVLSLMALASTTCGSDSVAVSENRGGSLIENNTTKRLRTIEKTVCENTPPANSLNRLKTNELGVVFTTNNPSETKLMHEQHSLTESNILTTMSCVYQQNDSPNVPIVNTPEFVQHPEIKSCVEDYSYPPSNDQSLRHNIKENSFNNKAARFSNSLGPSSFLKKKNERKKISLNSSHNRVHTTVSNALPSTVPFMLAYRLPRSPTARAAIMLYPYPPLPPQLLPELRHSHHQALFLQYIKTESSPLKIQLAHFVIEHCTRSIPEELIRSDVVNPDIQVIEDFVQQILYSVEVFGEQARYHHGRDPIPSDINELYISKWLRQNQHLLHPLQILYHRRQHQQNHHQNTVENNGVPMSGHGSSRNNKHRRKIGVSLGEELDALGVPKAINYENLTLAIANRGLVVQLPSHSDQSSKPVSTGITSQHNTQYARLSAGNKSFFNLLIAGRGDTRRSRLELPWGEVVKIKYNRTLLGIPDFVVEALGYRSFSETGGMHHLIPKVCAVSLEDSPYGVEILLFYRGMPCSKRSHNSHKQQLIPPSRRLSNPVSSNTDSCVQNSRRVICSKRVINPVINQQLTDPLNHTTKRFSLNTVQPKRQDFTDDYSLNLISSSALLGFRVPKSRCIDSSSPPTTILPQCKTIATLLTSPNQYSLGFDSDCKDEQNWENSHCNNSLPPLYWEKEKPGSPKLSRDPDLKLCEITNINSEVFSKEDGNNCHSILSKYTNLKGINSFPSTQFTQELLKDKNSKKLCKTTYTFQSNSINNNIDARSSLFLSNETENQNNSLLSRTSECCCVNVSSPFTNSKLAQGSNNFMPEVDNETAMILMTSLLLEEPTRIAGETILLDRQDFSTFTEESLLTREAFQSCSENDERHKQLSSTFNVDENGSPLHNNFTPTLLTSPQTISSSSFSVSNNDYTKNPKLLHY